MKSFLGLRATAAIAVVCALAFSSAACAQMTTVTTTCLGGAIVSGSCTGPNVVANATIYWQSIVQARAGTAGGQIVSGQPSQAQVTGGVSSIVIADALLSSPNICYAVTAVDNATGNVLLGTGLNANGQVNKGGVYGCVQPTGTTWSFDTYVPPASPPVIYEPVPGPTGPAGPTGPQGPAGAGGTLDVNGTQVTNPNYNATDPAAPSGDQNCTWQVDGSNVSCYVSSSGGGGSGGILASGTATLSTAAIGSGSCASVVTVAASGVTTSDTISVGFLSDPTSIAGYGVSAIGAILSVYDYPTAGNVNFKVCNNTANSVSPGSMTLSWIVMQPSSTVASGTATLGTSAIASGSCASVVTVAASGVSSTETLAIGFQGDPTSIAGYGTSATGAVLTVYAYPTAGDVNFKVCNSTSTSITPGAMTINWEVY